MDLKQFTEAFFSEVIELLGDMQRLLLQLDPQAPSDEQLNAIFRAAHSIKGGAATFGFWFRRTAQNARPSSFARTDVMAAMTAFVRQDRLGTALVLVVQQVLRTRFLCPSETQPERFSRGNSRAFSDASVVGACV